MKATEMPSPGPPFLLDVPAVRAWADAGGNESQAVLAAINEGKAHIYNRVWDSATGAYPDECGTLPKDQFKRKRCVEEHRLSAAAYAEKLKATFPIKGTYDDAIEWTVVGIATTESFTIVTDQRRKERYQKIDGIVAITYDEFVAHL